jgi:hypothetical protein
MFGIHPIYPHLPWILSVTRCCSCKGLGCQDSTSPSSYKNSENGTELHIVVEWLRERTLESDSWVLILPQSLLKLSYLVLSCFDPLIG